MLSTKHITSLFFIGILVISGVAPVFSDTFGVSNTVVSPLVVQFGDSVEEMAAIAELKSNFPRARVVDFSAYDRIVSFTGPIIYVGHSSDQGIQYNGMTVSWDVLATIIRHSKSNSHYMLGCESSKITELLTRNTKTVFSFREEVDAILGSNIISLNLLKNSQQIAVVANKLLTRLQYLIMNIANPLLLIGSYPNFKGDEPFWDVLNFVLLVASLGISTYGLFKDAIKATVASFILALVDPIANLVGLITNGVSLGAFVGSLWGFLPIFVALIASAALKLSFWAALAAGAELAAASTVAYWIAKGAIIFAGLMDALWFILGLNSDLKDPDGIASMPWETF